MIQRTYTKRVRSRLLSEELVPVAGRYYMGFATAGERVTINLGADTPPDTLEAIDQVVNAHDPTGLTSAEQAEKDEVAQIEADLLAIESATTLDQLKALMKRDVERQQKARSGRLRVEKRD